VAELGGPYSATQTATVSFPDWWLEVLEDSSYSMQLFVVDFKRQNEEEQTKYHALGRSKTIVVRGVIRGESLDLKLEFLTVADYNKFEAVRNLQRTVLLRRGYTGEQWYISFDAARVVEEAPADYTYKIIDISATEVDAP
jgi:hypothetical protein